MRIVACLFRCGCGVALLSIGILTAGAVDYTDIAPILQANCVSCHVPPPSFHSVLENVIGNCEQCHSSDPEDNGVSDKGWPDLTTQAAVEEAIARGTFRQWIQPGGLMGAEPPEIPQGSSVWPSHLTAAEVDLLTAYADTVSAGQTLSYDPVLVAAQVSTPPVVDGDGSDPVWDEADEHVIATQPTYYTATTQVKMKAVYTDADVFFRVEYLESTASMTRSNSWLWTGSVWQYPPAETENDKQSEDRLTFIWNKSIPNFQARHGCAYKCHGNVAGLAESFTDLEGERGDIWHSKAARGLGTINVRQEGVLTIDPVSHEVTAGHLIMNGYLDDKHLVWRNGPGFDTEDAGRRGDGGSSADSRNRNSTQDAPKFMESDPQNYVDAMVLTQEEIDTGETFVVDPTNNAYVGDAAVNAAWAKYQSFSAVVPERILRTPLDSRGNVRMSASWNNGTWVIELHRALDTGHPEDDIIFSDLGADYEFGLAVFDNCGRGEVPPGHTTYGDCQYQVLRFAGGTSNVSAWSVYK